MFKSVFVSSVALCCFSWQESDTEIDEEVDLLMSWYVSPATSCYTTYIVIYHYSSSTLISEKNGNEVNFSLETDLRIYLPS